MANQKVSQSDTGKPRFFYGYVIVISGLIILMTTFGLNYSFGIFFKPLIAEFGWSRAVTSSVYSIMTLLAGLLGIIGGRLSDKFGVRIVSTVSGIFLGVGFILMSQVNNIWQVYLVYGLIVGAGVGACWPILMPLVPQWFVTRKGLMTGIFSSGVGFGIIVFPSVASWLIYNLDWRTAYIIVGGVAMVLIIVAAQFLKRGPKQIGQRPFGEDKVNSETISPKDPGFDFKNSIRTRHFAFMFTIYFFFGFCLHSVMVHIVPLATELGIPIIIATSIISMIGILSIVGKLVIGSASDKFGVKVSLVFSFVLLFLALVWLQFARELWMFYLFATVFALAYGGVMMLQVLMLAQLFGLRSPGFIVGIISFAYAIGGAVGPFITGYIFDITNNYSLAFLLCAILAVAGSILTALLKRPAKIR